MRKNHTVPALAIKKYYQRNPAPSRKPYNTRYAIHIYFNTAARTTALAFCEGVETNFRNAAVLQGQVFPGR